MSSLYIDRKDVELDVENGATVLRVAGTREGTVPLAGIERLIVRGSATLSARLLAELWRQGVGLLVVSGRRNEPTARLLGRPHSDVRLRLAQYELMRNEEQRTLFAHRLVAAKLRGQLLLLRTAREQRPDLRLELTRGLAALETARERLVDGAAVARRSALFGLEGAAASAYFEAFAALFAPSLGFSGRNRRPPRDPVNAVLSLGYTLLHFEAALAAHCAGFDPLLGIYHEPAFGRESLASDLVEPWRPRVDGWTWALFRERTLRLEDFATAEGACLLGKAGRMRFYTAWESHAGILRRALRRQCAGLRRRLLAGAGAHLLAPEHEREERLDG